MLLLGWTRPGPLPRWAHISQVLPHLILAASAESLLTSAAKVPTAKANITLRILNHLLFSQFDKVTRDEREVCDRHHTLVE
jgi:hypothetical protein